ncbi:MAG: hypothetical protein FWG62_04930 [Proteobacteria bacterium]|nr:hypothetical protein [Pseudomonadota bacterium]
MKKLVLLVVVAILLIHSVIASALVIGPSNLGPIGYPSHNCTQPIIPISRDSFSVEMFNRELVSYKVCIYNYVESADNDRKRIVESANEAIVEYNNFINSISR